MTWARHIRPQLGGVLIRDLTPGRVDAFREGLERGGVGDATVAKALAVLSGLCRFAVLRGFIDANPVREVGSHDHGARGLWLRHYPRLRRTEDDYWLM